RHQGARVLERLWQGASALGSRAGGAAAVGARRGVALPADAAGGFPQRAAGRAGEAEGPAGIRAQAALPPGGQRYRRLRRCADGIAGVSDLPAVVIHTDGACSGNPGPGGWGAILQFGEVRKELKGGEPHTTNNRMELLAAIS